jgi:aminoglycoside N3'-acetyltransferase
MAAVSYTRDELVAAIRAVGIDAGDVVSLQVSLGRLGLPRGVASNYTDISNLVIDCFLDVVTPKGTLVIPTYTYSIGRGEIFEVEKTPSTIGEFPEVFRKRAEVTRSRDPMLSSAAIGLKANEILRGISRSCYGEGSTFHRLRDADAKICTLGLGLWWTTFLHHIEDMADVPFRFRKKFQGRIRESGVETTEEWIYFAAPYQSCCQSDPQKMEQVARTAGLVNIAPIGRGEVMATKARDYFELGMTALTKNPWLTAKGPPASAETIFYDEPQYWQQSGSSPSQA